jgi:hypothetical protein
MYPDPLALPDGRSTIPAGHRPHHAAARAAQPDFWHG